MGFLDVLLVPFQHSERMCLIRAQFQHFTLFFFGFGPCRLPCEEFLATGYGWMLSLGFDAVLLFGQ